MSTHKNPQDHLSALGADISGKVTDALHEAQPVFNRMADRVSDGMHNLANQGKEAAAEAGHKLQDEARHARVVAEHYVEHAPFKSILMAAGAGAVTALAVSWFMRSHKN